MYVSIEGQGHFLTIYFPGFVCFVLYKANISGERLQNHWSSGSCLTFYYHYVLVWTTNLLFGLLDFSSKVSPVDSSH